MTTLGTFHRAVCHVQGFELHPEQWLPHADFEDCEALDVWDARKVALLST